MPFIPLDDLTDPRLADYLGVRDPELLRRGNAFVAEGRQVVRTLLAASPLAVRSLLVTQAGLAALQDAIAPHLATVPVFVVPQEAVERLTGYNIHRGCLAIGQRPAPLSAQSLLGLHPGASTLVGLERVGNADNVGAIFRNVAAFGADGVILGPGCCDPLYRKAVRVSMGAALRVPFAVEGDWPGALRRLAAEGFTVAALTPRPGAMTIDEVAGSWESGRRLVLLAGAEGDGLSEEALGIASLELRISMAPGVDSLNVATATAIALHRLAARPRA